MITDGLALSISHHSGSPSRLNVLVQPSFHYFVTNGLSLGIGLTLEHESDDENFGTGSTETVTDNFGLGFSVGYNIRLSRLVSLWPRAFLGVYYEHQRRTQTPSEVDGEPLGTPSDESADLTGFDIGLYAPLLIHPTEHFLLGFGPLLRYDHVLNNTGLLVAGNTVEIAAESLIGGWF